MKKYFSIIFFVIFICIITVSMSACSLFNKGNNDEEQKEPAQTEETIDFETGKSILIGAVRNTFSATDIKVEGTAFGYNGNGPVSQSVELVTSGKENDYKGSMTIDYSTTVQRQYVGYYDGYGLCWLVETEVDNEDKPFKQHQEVDLDFATELVSGGSAILMLRFHDAHDLMSKLNETYFSAKKITTNKNEVSYKFEFDIDGQSDWSSDSAVYSYTVTVKDNYLVSYKADITEEGDYEQTVDCKISYGQFEVEIPESISKFYFDK